MTTENKPTKPLQVVNAHDLVRASREDEETQRFTIFDVLVSYCAQILTPDVIDRISAEIRRELQRMKRDGLIEPDNSQRNNTKWKLIEQPDEVKP